MLHVGGTVEAFDENEERLRRQVRELLLRLLTLRLGELADVGLDEALDDRLIAGNLFFGQDRQAGRQRMPGPFFLGQGSLAQEQRQDKNGNRGHDNFRKLSSLVSTLCGWFSNRN